MAILLLSSALLAQGADATSHYVGTTADVVNPSECAIPGNSTCSLRSAISLANAYPGSTIIIPAGTYRLSEEMRALPTITASMHIRGAGPEVTILDAQRFDQVLNIEPSTADAIVTIEGLTVTHGRMNTDHGAGIRWYTSYETSELHLLNLHATHNRTEGLETHGGGLGLKGGRVHIEGSLIESNSAESGGGVYAIGVDLTIKESTIRENHATELGGGIYISGGSADLAESEIADNEAYFGGGIAATEILSGELRIERSIIAGNKGVDSHTHWNSSAAHWGAGLYGDRLSSVIVSDSVFKENDGAGIYIQEGNTQVFRTIVERNSRGGLLVTGDLLFDRGAVVGNESWGGIRHTDGNATIRNSTIVGNDSQSGLGGGLSAGNATVINSTVTNNRSGSSVGGVNLFGHSRLYNTIVAQNSSEMTIGYYYNNIWAQSPFAPGDAAHNLIGDTHSANASGLHHGEHGNIVGVDPRLGPLEEFDGPTWVRPLLPGSPAADAGDNQYLDDILVDQRGAPRISNGFVDIGAYEYPFEIDTNTSRLKANSTSITTDDTATIQVELFASWKRILVGGDEVTLHTTHGTLSEVIDHGDGTYSATLSATTPGTATITAFVKGVAIAASETVEISVGAADPATSTITPEPVAITTTGTSTITVQLKDAYGNNLIAGGDEVTLHAMRGMVSPVVDHGNGTYTAIFYSLYPSSFTITGMVNGIPIEADVTVNVAKGQATTLYVGTTNDVDDIYECHLLGNTSCSLRSAIIIANAHPGSTVLIPAGTYALSEEMGPLPTITETMYIQGADPETTVIDAQNHFRLFTIEPFTPDTTVTIAGLTLTNGYVNHEDGHGAGIHWYASYGTSALHLINLRVTHNQTEGAGSSGGGLGLTGGRVRIEGSLIQFNTANLGGGGIYANGVDLTIRESLVQGNTVQYFDESSSYGGGIYIRSGKAYLTDSEIRDNEAVYGGGIAAFNMSEELRIERAIVQSNHGPTSASNSPNSGGLWGLSLSSVVVSDSVFKENGGTGLRLVDPHVQVFRTIVEGNQYGGLYVGNGDLLFDSGLVVGNSYYGGIFHLNGDSTIRNSTIVGNSHTLWHGGGGIYANNATVINSTVTDNHSTTSGAGLYLLGSARLYNSIVANNVNVTGNEPADIYVPHLFAPGQAAHNIIGDAGSANAARVFHGEHGNIVGVDPLLGPLEAFDGSIPVRPLLPGSPAIDAGDNQYLSNIPVDQRGEPRVSNGFVDMGAFEYQVVPDAGTSTMTANPASITALSTSTITVQLKDADGTNLRAGGQRVTLHTTHGTLSAVTDHGDGTYSATLSAMNPGTAIITGTLNGVTLTSSVAVTVEMGEATTFYVGTTDDVEAFDQCTTPNNSTCSLRSAITLANAHRGSTVLIPAGTYRLTDERGPLPTITGSMRLQGAGPEATVIDAQNHFRVFTLQPRVANTTITLEGLTATNGSESGSRAMGAGILWYAYGYATSDLHLLNVHVTHSHSEGSNNTPGGGGIGLVYGTVHIEGSRIQANSSNRPGGGIYSQNVDLTIKESLIRENADIGIYISGGSAYLVDNEIRDHYGVSGGGIYAFDMPGELRIERSIIQRSHQPTEALSAGHGLFGDQLSSVVIADSVFKENDGAGIYLREQKNAEVHRTILERNQHGGIVVESGVLLFEGGAVVGNENRGGIWYGGSRYSTIRNSTIVANRGTADAAGGIYANNATVANSTVTDNHVDGDGAGIHLLGNSRIYNTIAVNNSDENNESRDIQVDRPFDPGNAAHNIIGHASSANVAGIYHGEHGNIVGVDPMIGPLEKDGQTWVRPLLPGSPAIDAGDNQYTGGIPSDQRGEPRISNRYIDIGAFEYQVVLDTNVSTLTADPVAIATGGTSTITVQLRDAHGVHFRAAWDEVAFHTTHGTLSTHTHRGDGTYSAGLRATEPGTATITVTVNGVPLAASATVEVTAVADAGTSTLTADPALITTDGASTITVQLKDAHGNSLGAGGDTVELSTTHGTLSSVTDHGDGTYTATLSATSPGSATITGTVNGAALAASVTVEVSVSAADAGKSSITADPASITTSGTSTITVQLKDAHGNDLIAGGDTVDLSTTHGTLSAVTDHGNGTYLATLSATSPGTAIITGTVNGRTIAHTAYVEVEVGGAEAAHTLVAATPSEVFIGAEGALVTVRLFDVYGNPLPRGGDDVQILTDLGEVRNVVDRDDGAYTATLVAFSPGVATVTILVNGESVPESISVTFVAHESVDEDVQMTQSISPRYSEAGDAVTITITMQNDSGQTLENVSVTNHLSSHLEYIGDGAFHGLMAMTHSIHPMSLQPVYDPTLRTVTWTIPILHPGESVELSLQAVVQSVPEGTAIPNLVTANVGGSTAVASASATTTVGEWPDLAVSKVADQTEAAIGQLVGYRVTVTNEGSVTSHGTLLIDTLPEGFVYIEGSSRLNGSALIEPTLTDGRLVWSLGELAPGDAMIVEYVMLISLAATGSDGINRAMVEAQSPSGFTFATEPVTATVRIRSGMFGSLGGVAGTVYLDVNGNGERDPDEPGLAGVAIYTDDGRRVVTDSEGRYALAGLYPGLRSLKVYGPSERGDGELHLQSQFVTVPVSGVALLNFGLSQAPVEESTPAPPRSGAGPHAALPPPLMVGTIDLFYPSGGPWALRYGSFFGHWEIGSKTTITLRHHLAGTADPSALEGFMPTPPTNGESRPSGSVTPQLGSTFLQIRSGNATLTYGAMRPEDGRRNRYTSRTSPLVGVRFEFVGGSQSGLSAYHAPITGTDRLERIDALGMSGPYYLSHAPVARGSVEVWLVVGSDDGSGREIERTPLLEGVDYRMDWEHGVLWLTDALPGYDESLRPRHLEVAYRTVDVGVVGELRGLRLDALTPWGRTGISASDEQRGGTTHRLLGLDGVIGFGDSGSLAYELGVSQLTHSQGTESGTGLHVSAGSAMTSRLRWEVEGEWIDGAYRAPGDREANAGLRLSGTLAYRLDNRLRLAYERQYMQSGGGAARHRDRLRLTSVLPGSHPIELRAGLESEGASVMIGDGRTTRVYTGAGWSWGDRHRLTIDTGLEARSDQDWRLVAPTEFSYRFADAGWAASLGYRHPFGMHDAGAWIGSVEVAPSEGLNLYTRVEKGEGQESMTVGGRQGWSLADDLQLTLSLEGRLTPGGSARTAAGLDLVYEPEDGRSTGALRYEIERTGIGTRSTTRASWRGVVGSAWTVQLNGLWLSGENPSAGSRSVLNEEITLSIDYRDPLRSRHALSSQLILREYTQPGLTGGSATLRDVSVASIDWAYRAGDRIALNAKLAGKQEGVGTAHAAVGLAQAGVELSLSRSVAVELFHRSLWDSTGATLNGHAAELVYYLNDDLGVSVGTSTMAIDDPDLSLVAPWPEGVYFRVRMKW